MLNIAILRSGIKCDECTPYSISVKFCLEYSYGRIYILYCSLGRELTEAIHTHYNCMFPFQGIEQNHSKNMTHFYNAIYRKRLILLHAAGRMEAPQNQSNVMSPKARMRFIFSLLVWEEFYICANRQNIFQLYNSEYGHVLANISTCSLLALHVGHLFDVKFP